MAEYTVTQSDIASLANKLDEMADVLSDKERTLMLAIFRLAAQAISGRVGGTESGSQSESGSAGPRPPGPGMARTAALSEGFRNAFKPLGSREFSMRDNLDKVAGGVGIGIIW